jgi:hypothetical protein
MNRIDLLALVEFAFMALSLLSRFAASFVPPDEWGDPMLPQSDPEKDTP